MSSMTLVRSSSKFGLVAGIALFGACSGPQEDVRVTFCKDLATHQLESPRAVDWKKTEKEIRRPEYAKITLTFTAEYRDGGVAPVSATCHYAYDVPEENAITHSDPLSAYATVPYKMAVNGESVALQDLHKAINAVALKQGKELADRVQKGVADTAEKLKKELTQ